MKRSALIGICSIILVTFRLWAGIYALWGEPRIEEAFVKILTVVGWLALGCGLRFLLPYVIYALQQIGEKGWKAWPRFEAKYVSSFALAFIGYGVILVTVPGAVGYLAAMQPLAVVALAYAGQDLGQNVIKRVRERQGGW